MQKQLWTEIGIVERYLHQPWTAVAEMPLREFRLHVMTAVYWRHKEIEAESEES